MVRMMLLLKQSRRELVRIVHPSVVNPVVLAGARGQPDRVLQSVIAYMMIYGATLVGLTMLLLFSGLDVGHRLLRGGRLRQQHRPRAGRGRAGGQLRRPERLPDLGLQLRRCCSAGSSCCRVLVLFTPRFWRR